MTAAISPTRTPATQWRELIARYWLPVGYLVLLTGLFWLDNSSIYKKLFYWLFAAPALFAVCLSPRLILNIGREPIIQAFLALSAWLLLSLLWSPADDPQGLVKRPLYVLLLFVGCAVIACNSRERLGLALCVSAWIAVAFALVNAAHFAWTAQPGERLVGFGALRNPLLSSHVFGFFTAYWMAMFVAHTTGINWRSVIACVALLAVLLATGSRTPLAALVACGIWLAALAGKRGLLAVLALLFACAAVLLMSPEMLLERGMSYRPQLWEAAFNTAMNHPLVGHGFHAEFQFNVVPGWPLSDPHNVELAVLLELGAVGLGLWGLMYACAFWKAIEYRRDEEYLAASTMLVYGLVAGMSEGSSYLSRPNESWFLIWLPLSFMAALSIRRRLFPI